jgi:hypothetical protein
MGSHDLHMNDSESRHLQGVSEYRDTVANLLPVACRPIVNDWSVSRRDLLSLVRFLDRYPRETEVLEIGTFLGVSTFNFASHRKVSRVVSIDWNPSLAELNLSGEIPDPGFPLREVRVLDLAEQALTHFPEQQRKIRVVAGTVETVSLPSPSNGTSLIAFIDGEHTRESVTLDLCAIFAQNPTALVVLHDCRGSHSPAIFAGIATFLEDAAADYCFRLFEPPGPGLKPPNLGAIYDNAIADEVDRLGSGLLASPKTSLIQAALAAWRCWNRQRGHANREEQRANREQERAAELQRYADRQRKRASRQRKRADRLEAELQKARQGWWRIFRS